MKIAIPSMDGNTISAHFGRSKGFLVFETDNGIIKGREFRENNQGHFGQGHDQHGEACQGHDHKHSHHHDHGEFARLLDDCQALIVRGMGAGALHAMRAAGIKVCLVQDECPPEDAVARFITGRLQEQEGNFCGCHGHQY